MNITIKQTKEQQLKAFKTYLKYNNQGVMVFWFILFIFSLFRIITTINEIVNTEADFNFLNSSFIVSVALLIYFIFVTIRLLSNQYKFKKHLQTFDFKVFLNSEYFEIDFEETKTKYEWKS